MDNKIESTSFYRQILSEILKGYSFFDGIFISHPKLDSEVDREIQYERYFKQAKDRGVKTEKELLKFLNNQGIWTNKEDEFLSEKKEFFNTLNMTFNKMPNTRDREEVGILLKKAQIEYHEIQDKKNKLIGHTCEKFAEQKVQYYYIYHSLYKDKKLNELYISEDQFEDTDFDFYKYVGIYNIINNNFSYNNIKNLSIQDFARQIIGLSKSAYEFYGMAISKLTYNQIHFYDTCKGIDNLIKEHPETHKYNNFDQIIEHIENKKNNVNAKGRNRELVGAKGEANDNADNLGALFAKAKKNGGTLNMTQR